MIMTLEEYDNYEVWKARRKMWADDDRRPTDYRDNWNKVLEDPNLSHEVYQNQRERFCFQKKQEQITHTLETLAANGIEAKLACFDNCHIMAKSKSGKKMSFYAGTGTITGYQGTQVKGVDEFIRLLRTI